MMHNIIIIIIIIRARTKTQSIRSKLGQTGLKRLVTQGAEMHSHEAHRQKQNEKRIKNQKNMDYFVRTQYIHDMK